MYKYNMIKDILCLYSSPINHFSTFETITGKYTKIFPIQGGGVLGFSGFREEDLKGEGKIQGGFRPPVGAISPCY